ncbi:cell division protein FtsZ [Thermogemmatispora tikiterensis]|uniref:Cell division protein FtsZ n=1 Tax=Thermogemmatispora tikiterensis TaxID=1825093 RepID=A0A328VE55_9CHLR|nr:cell division protein FtsZ [Thermogemmatispora tikiterensis]RAQ95956.1 cell division protein FtsZ [Thermogemmatispora tikiterensis]
MQSISHGDRYERGRPWDRQGQAANEGSDFYDEQANRWAVLRHEVEVGEDMREEHTLAGWEQRDTEEEMIATEAPADAEERCDEPRHVDIVVAGVGGGGTNAVNRMIDMNVRGVRFIAMNTDAQVLELSQAPLRISLGYHYTKGLGAGGNAAVGMRAATESAAEIRAALKDADLVFITAGLGGGTGTGAAPVVASIARKLGALTIGIVTLPFSFEGSRRRRVAQEGLAELSKEVDALITVPNDRLLMSSTRDRSLAEAFKVADDVLRQGVQGIAEVINVPGLVNVDFADVRNVLRDAGSALMSIGEGKGRNRAQIAAQQAIAGGFLNVTIKGAHRVLFNISGGEDLTLFEVNEVAECIRGVVDEAADITFGAVIDPTLQDSLRVTLIAAGMGEPLTAQTPALISGAPRPAQLQAPAQASNGAGTPEPARASHQMIPMPPLTPRPSLSQGTPAASATPLRPPALPRPQRSLEDLRGLRSLARRYQERLEQEREISAPPFLRRR